MRGSRLAPRLLCLALAAVAGVGGPMTIACADMLADGRFRDEVLGIVRTMRPDADILPDADPAEIRVGSRTISLTNLYPRVKDLPAAPKRKEIEAFLASMLPGTSPQPCCASRGYEEVKARLRVQLVPLEIIRAHPELARRPFSETLSVVYVLDEAERYQYVTRDLLTHWKVDQEVVEAVAIANLAKASMNVRAELALDGDTPSYLVSQGGDDYDAARLLVPDFLNELRKNLKADAIVVAGPTRNLLMAWPAESKHRAGFASAVTRMMREGPYGRSDELFRFDANGLRALTSLEKAEHGRKR